MGGLADKLGKMAQKNIEAKFDKLFDKVDEMNKNLEKILKEMKK